MLEANLVSFRRLELNDLKLVHQWLNKPHVRKFYDKDKSCTLEDIKNRYTPKVIGKGPTQAFIFSYQDQPVGYIQTYNVAAWPEYAKAVGFGGDTAGVDLFIGNPEFIRKGLGHLVLKKFLEEVVFSREDISNCIMGPEPNNIMAIKSYSKAGFKYIKTVKVTGEPESEYLMLLTKSQKAV